MRKLSNVCAWITHIHTHPHTHTARRLSSTLRARWPEKKTLCLCRTYPLHPLSLLFLSHSDKEFHPFSRRQRQKSVGPCRSFLFSTTLVQVGEACSSEYDTYISYKCTLLAGCTREHLHCPTLLLIPDRSVSLALDLFIFSLLWRGQERARAWKRKQYFSLPVVYTSAGEKMPRQLSCALYLYFLLSAELCFTRFWIWKLHKNLRNNMRHVWIGIFAQTDKVFLSEFAGTCEDNLDCQFWELEFSWEEFLLKCFNLGKKVLGKFFKCLMGVSKIHGKWIFI